jgi:hypothetical protein
MTHNVVILWPGPGPAPRADEIRLTICDPLSATGRRGRKRAPARDGSRRQRQRKDCRGQLLFAFMREADRHA